VYPGVAYLIVKGSNFIVKPRGTFKDAAKDKPTVSAVGSRILTQWMGSAATFTMRCASAPKMRVNLEMLSMPSMQKDLLKMGYGSALQNGQKDCRKYY